MYSKDDVYFAALEQYSPDYLEALIDKVNTYRQFCQSTGLIAKWQRSMSNYYGKSTDGQKVSNQVTRGGEDGQLVMAKVNDYRNLIQHQLILITSQRPAGQAKAINSDPESLHQARIGSSLTEYYLSQVGWEKKFVTAAEISLVDDESFFALDWNATVGEKIRPNPETGKMIMSGDSELRVIEPWNMARDPLIQSPDDMKWGIFSYRVNRFDLAAKFPQFKDSILKGSTRQINDLPFEIYDENQTDTCTLYVLSHDRTPACENGRITMFVPDAILLDGEFPYPEFNLYRMSQNDVIGTCFGYSNNSDLLALEEITDALHSVVMSNQTAFGAQAIIGPKGCGLVHQELAKGFAYFEVEDKYVDKIKPLQLTKTAPEIFNYIEVLGRKKETLAGINSVVRGDPEGALRSNSGSALALVQAQSLQFNSGGQRSYYHALSRVNTGHIKLLQKYADAEKVVRITGKVQGQFLEEFKYTKENLQNISSVVFEAVDAAFQTIGGKMKVAEDLLNKGLIKNARQYINVVRTGNLDVLTEDDEADELAVKAENARLREGRPVQVIIVENHEEHIKSHMSVIASPESKENTKLVSATLQHIEEHAATWQELSLTNPALLIATGQKVLPPPPGMGMPEMPPQGGQGAPPPGPGGEPSEIMGGEPPVETASATVKQPNMPTNPATGDKAQVAGM